MIFHVDEKNRDVKMPKKEKFSDSNKTALPAANVEQNTGHEHMGKKKAKGLDTRVNIHVISYRKAKHDPDGVSAKAVIDGIVRRGILSDDSTDEVRKVTFESIICSSLEEEKTEIQIKFNDEQLNK